jgi:hypothetical protein
MQPDNNPNRPQSSATTSNPNPYSPPTNPTAAPPLQVPPTMQNKSTLPETDPQYTPKRSDKKVMIIVIGLVMLAAIALVLLFVTLANNPDDNTPSIGSSYSFKQL